MENYGKKLKEAYEKCSRSINELAEALKRMNSRNFVHTSKYHIDKHISEHQPKPPNNSLYWVLLVIMVIYLFS